MKKTLTLILDTILLLVLLFSVISKSVPIYIIAILLILYFAYCIYISGFKKANINNKKKIVLIQLMLCLILIFIYYILGSKMGFQENIACIFKKYINIVDCISIIVIILITELIRYKKINKINNDKKKINIESIIFMINLILIDILIYPSGYSIQTFKEVYILLGLIIGASITKNLYLNYLSEKTNYYATIIYRVITELYILLIPVIPNINLMIKTVLFTVFPYISFIIQDSFLTKKKITDIKKENKLSYKITTYLLIVVLILFLSLVSGEFKYTLIAVGSESMSGTIEKGDTVVYQKYSDNVKLEEGDIIVFKKNGITIIHRIEKIYDFGNEQQFKTKGDANSKEDSWIVTQKDIIGVVRNRVKWIGYPAVWLSELF